MPRRSTKPLTPLQELVKEMKPYEVVELDGEWGHLRCPRSDCAQDFKVKRKEFKESRRQVGRSCPYCFRVSGLPGAQITEDTVRGDS